MNAREKAIKALELASKICFDVIEDQEATEAGRACNEALTALRTEAEQPDVAGPKFGEQGIQFGNLWISYDELVGCRLDPGPERDNFWKTDVFAKGFLKWLNEYIAALRTEAEQPGRLITLQDVKLGCGEIGKEAVIVAEWILKRWQPTYGQAEQPDVAGLDEEDVMVVYLAWEQFFNTHGGTPAKRSGNFRARIKNAIKLKADLAAMSAAPVADQSTRLGHCSGCTDPRSEGTHQVGTIEHPETVAAPTDVPAKPAVELTKENSLAIAIEYGYEMAHVKEFMEWATPRINARLNGPVVTHLNMDPNASDETRAAVGEVIRAAYDYKPGGSLSVNIRTWRDKIADLKPHRVDALADHAERLEAELAAAKSAAPVAGPRVVSQEEYDRMSFVMRGGFTPAPVAAPTDMLKPAGKVLSKDIEEAAREWYRERYHVDVDECGYGHSARRAVGDLVEFAMLHLAPAPSVSVDQVMDILEDAVNDMDDLRLGKRDTMSLNDYRARLTAIINPTT